MWDSRKDQSLAPGKLGATHPMHYPSRMCPKAPTFSTAPFTTFIIIAEDIHSPNSLEKGSIRAQTLELDFLGSNSILSLANCGMLVNSLNYAVPQFLL